MFVGDEIDGLRQSMPMLGHDDLLAILRERREAGKTSNAEIGRVIKQPSSRVAEIFNGKRRISLDEAKLLVEALGIEERYTGPSEETLIGLMTAMLPLVPSDGLKERDVPKFARVLAYGIELLEGDPSSRTNPAALGVAARAALSRFRDPSPAS